MVKLSNLAEEKHAPCWGEQVCAARGWEFCDVFRHQFRIGRSRAVSDWQTCRLGSHWIEHCPDLPITRVLNRRGQHIGWCLGVAVDASGTAYGYEGAPSLTMSASFEAVERRQSQMAGRFALMIKIGDEVRYYPDSTSALTAVVNPTEGVIASTVPLAIPSKIQPSGGRSFKEIQGKTTLYLMGETVDTRVTQALGNHYVDMSDFSSHRFWPKDDTPFQPHDNPEHTVEQIADRLQTVITALINAFDCTLPLTGGNDLRLLAASVPAKLANRISHIYVHEINWTSGFDVASAQKVAAHLSLPLEVKRVLAGDCDAELVGLDLRIMRAQVALATGYAHPRLHGSVLRALHVAPTSRLLLRGGAAEMVHANKWPIPSRIPDQVTADFAFQRLAGHGWDDLLKLYGEKTVERYWEKYKQWFNKLPQAARTRAPDIGHAELWLSSGMGSVFYQPRQHFYINPFSDRSLLHRTMRFNPRERKKGQLLKTLLDHFSPGLSSVPYARELQRANRAA